MAHSIRLGVLALFLGSAISATTVAAEPLKIVGLRLSNPQQIRLDFALVGAEKHFGAYVRRDGTVTAGST